jgi:putative FmdB family regulatory protein
MPTYEYEAVERDNACEHCRNRFEVRQSIRDPALEKCPQCGNAITRLISRVDICTAPSAKSRLSDKNLKAKGFTKLVNEGGGKFRKVT